MIVSKSIAFGASSSGSARPAATIRLAPDQRGTGPVEPEAGQPPDRHDQVGNRENGDRRNLGDQAEETVPYLSPAGAGAFEWFPLRHGRSLWGSPVSGHRDP